MRVSGLVGQEPQGFLFFSIFVFFCFNSRVGFDDV